MAQPKECRCSACKTASRTVRAANRAVAAFKRETASKPQDKTTEKLNIGRALGDIRHQIGNLEYRFRLGERNLWPKLAELYAKERDLSVSYGMVARVR